MLTRSVAGVWLRGAARVARHAEKRALITKTRGANWRCIAIDMETGVILGIQVDSASLRRRLWREGWHLEHSIQRPAEVSA